MSRDGQNVYVMGTPEVIKAADFHEETESKKKKRPKTGKTRSTAVEEEKHAQSEFTPVPNFETGSVKSKQTLMYFIFL